MPRARLRSRSERRLPVAVLALVLLVAGCSSGRSSTAGTTTTAAPTSTSGVTTTVSGHVPADLANVHKVVALGDSVPFGTACDCTPYPGLSGADLTKLLGHEVTTWNDAQPGVTSAGVLQQLDHEASVRTDVSAADAALLEVGANDVGHSSRCELDLACYEADLPELRSNLESIVDRLHSSSADHDLPVVMLDYWSVWLGGRYAQEQGPDYVETVEALTTKVNDIIRSVAASTGSRYVDLRTAFRGPDGAWDETHLLAPDGDHPNAEGHQRIAQAVAVVVRQDAPSGG